jgi:hypothetical protein
MFDCAQHTAVTVIMPRPTHPLPNPPHKGEGKSLFFLVGEDWREAELLSLPLVGRVREGVTWTL